jgi:hypothetical protein
VTSTKDAQDKQHLIELLSHPHDDVAVEIVRRDLKISGGHTRMALRGRALGRIEGRNAAENPVM